VLAVEIPQSLTKAKKLTTLVMFNTNKAIRAKLLIVLQLQNTLIAPEIMRK
jgi:hypothetical protein